MNSDFPHLSLEISPAWRISSVIPGTSLKMPGVRFIGVGRVPHAEWFYAGLPDTKINTPEPKEGLGADYWIDSCRKISIQGRVAQKSKPPSNDLSIDAWPHVMFNLILIIYLSLWFLFLFWSIGHSTFLGTEPWSPIMTPFRLWYKIYAAMDCKSIILFGTSIKLRQ